MARILIGNIKGPRGPQGIQGIQGPVGPQGPQGPLPPLINNFLATEAGVSALDAVAGATLKAQLDEVNGDLQTAYLLKGGTPIPAGADLKSDTYKVPGNYFCDGNNTVSTLINCPFSRAFALKVELGTGNGYPKQTFRQYDNGKITMRTFDSYNNSWMDEYSYVRNSDLATTTIDITSKLASQYVDSSTYTPYSILVKSGNVVTLMIFAAVKNLTGFDIILPAGAIPTSHRPKVEFTFSIHGRSSAQWLSATNYPVSLRAMEDGSVTLATGANHGNVAFINATCTYVL